MWQSVLAFDENPAWGLHQRALTDEAQDVLHDRLLASCIGSLELIRINGADAEQFLQGQTTCDFRKIAAGSISLGAHCNLKGRAQASFYALRQSEDFILLVPKGLGSPTRDLLDKYALFSKVSLTLDTQWLPLALLGQDVEKAIAALWNPLPDTGQYQQRDQSVLARLPSGGWLMLVPQQGAGQLLEQLQAAGFQLAGDNSWWLAQLRAGVVQVLPSQNELWIPQELNYDLIEGVSFKKGCYKGQEIIARLHYRGQTKTRIRLLEWQISQPVAPGTRILGPEDQAVGTVTQVAYIDEQTQLTACVLKTDITESTSLVLEANKQAATRWHPLPYAITNEHTK